MDRQTVFKRISKVLAVITMVFLLVSTVFAIVILYSAFREYVNTHEVNISQFYFNLAVCLAAIATVSLILAMLFTSRMEGKNKIKKTAILTGLIFYAIVLSIIFELTLYQYSYFPVIFFGLAFVTIVCVLLAVIPKGAVSRVRCFIKTRRNGE